MSAYGKCFTSKYIGLSYQLISSDTKIESSLEKSDCIDIRALWDTGATGSVVTPNIAKKLNLKPVEIATITTPSDKDKLTNIYCVNIYLPNKVKVSDVRVAEGIPANCDILIGMDIITLGDFAVSNYNGNTMFSFRVPSMTEIDFVENSYLSRPSNKQ
jgi:predicted aspartyl protease